MGSLDLGLVLIGVIVGGAALVRMDSLRSPEPFPPWMSFLLENPVRGLFFNRDRILRHSGLEPGMRVLEVGPGNGYVTERAAEILGPQGRLVCIDVQSQMLQMVQTRLGASAPPLALASGSVLPFRDAAFDLVYLITVLGEIPDKRSAMAEYRRVLRPGGVLAITEALPDPEYVRTPVTRRLGVQAGLEVGTHFGVPGQYTQRLLRPREAQAESGAENSALDSGT